MGLVNDGLGIALVDLRVDVLSVNRGLHMLGVHGSRLDSSVGGVHGRVDSLEDRGGSSVGVEGSSSRDGLEDRSGSSSVGDMRSSNDHRGSCDDSLDHGGGDNLSHFLLGHDSVESVDGISGVVHNTARTIGFDEAVLSLDHISVTGLVLRLVIASHIVLNAVREAVLGVVVLDMWQQTSAGHGNQGEEGDVLEMRVQ